MKFFFLLLVSLLGVFVRAEAARIKDVSEVAGIRSNQLVGYGLVTGLVGTGESTPFTDQSFNVMLQKFGIVLPPGVKPKNKNVAAVIVTANMPAFSKQGQSIDVVVSSIGSAKSLRGGTLVQTFLKGLDGEIYAVAQGNLLVSNFSLNADDGSKVIGNNPTAGMILNGAIVEREIPTPFSRGDFITFHLLDSDFTTAQRMVDAVNDFLGSQIAFAIDATTVKVRAPRDVSERVVFLSTIENLEFNPADSSAKIIINSRTGTIVIGKHVRLKPSAVTHGAMTVAIEEYSLDTDGKEGRMFKFEPGSTLDDLVRTVNEVGAAPSDLMAILQALKQAGAIEGKLIII
ncbi:flagellar P-ring protein [Candidatus Photodesmus blepharus]|uniref:Flagellar P-ring protein n=1 Tax=Candidatus Photodesmus blepharonis TaxID=1179155 RepID=A0A084CMF9_9GAMM|nr:flagellar basal body P-ring protein FlgI [Candidatus Photodesmus blepharus]KEY90988.1 flagellar P-ring protein [Candidatus Photodesmus blepharus]